MYRCFKPLKDTYITDRIIKGTRQNNTNLGTSSTLDLFVINGLNKSASLNLNELSRILIKFDIEDLKSDYRDGKLDPSMGSFWATLNLFDVYGGQPTPNNFTVSVYPLSRSWQEGVGKDVVYYQDSDVANFLTSSYTGATSNIWYQSGANATGLLGSADIDIISSGNLGAGIENLFVTQSFVDGSENLSVDVTKILSATIVGLIPDQGFRISFSPTDEQAGKTKFVKRFASRHSSELSIRPKITVGYDDSQISHEGGFYFDSSGSIFLENYVRGQRRNLVSGSTLTQITGDNCVDLKLVLQGVSGANGYVDYVKHITGSQHKVGTNYVEGVYSASFALLSNDPIYRNHLNRSGSVEFIQVWGSRDGTVPFRSGTLLVKPQDAVTGPNQPRKYSVNVVNTSNEYDSTDVARFKVFVFDYSRPYHRISKVPISTPTVVSDNAFYSIRDAHNNEVIIPFERTRGSTRLSADSDYMYFDLDMSNFYPGRSYVIDILLVLGVQSELFQDASPSFTVSSRNRGA